MDQAELVARHDDLVDLQRRPVVEPLDGDPDERVLVVRVEHVAQPVGIEDGPSGQDAVLAIGDERDLVRDIGLGLGRGGRQRPRERHPQATWEPILHARMVAAAPSPRHGPEVRGALASRA